jgi:serine/threonine-protein kinase RsbW
VLINYSLSLPRDALTVPVVRRLCKGAMVELGVTPSHIQDVSLAVTEACANVIEHSSDTEDQYEVTVALSEERCEIRVIDTGRGFDQAELSNDDPVPATAERGRGIRLMHALVDMARFDSRPEEGTVVHLQKALQLEDDSLFKSLSDRLAVETQQDGQRPSDA